MYVYNIVSVSDNKQSRTWYNIILSVSASSACCTAVGHHQTGSKSNFHLGPEPDQRRAHRLQDQQQQQVVVVVVIFFYFILLFDL